MLVFLLIWIIRRSKWAFLSILSLLLSWQQISVLIGRNFSSSFTSDKAPGTIRVLSWNVSRWDERNKQLRGGVSYRPLMMDFIQSQNADILCLQEFFECTDPKLFDSNIPALEKMGYRYHYFFPSSSIFNGKLQYGLAIFSRLPVIDSAKYDIDKSTHSEGICYADIKLKDSIIRVFNTHLQSIGLSQQDYKNLGKAEDSRSILGKIKKSYLIRATQVKLARTIIDSSSHKTILCGDIDDVPNSWAYFHIRQGFYDAFLESGLGLGRSFRFVSPTLRIDYIFSGKKMKVMQYTNPHLNYSDHYPVIADLKVN
ncbi:MAG: endonuclease/exonuclease/phosphatase family protein [Bacteroidetes bacterium]|nr:endonuclease/exonuclease/phosphatase family protein [Bacteroidota bacterium]